MNDELKQHDIVLVRVRLMSKHERNGIVEWVGQPVGRSGQDLEHHPCVWLEPRAIVTIKEARESLRRSL